MSTRATTVLTVPGHDRPDRGDRILVNGIADQASELTSACVAKEWPAQAPAERCSVAEALARRDRAGCGKRS
jgi:hypothetical protein